MTVQSSSADTSGPRQFALGDIVEMREGSPFSQEWRGVELKIVSLRIDPEGKQWVSTIDFKPGYLPRHRGNGTYDSETTDIDADYLSLIRPGDLAQKQSVTPEDEIEQLARDMQSRVSGEHRGALLYTGYLKIARYLIANGADGVLVAIESAEASQSVSSTHCGTGGAK